MTATYSELESEHIVGTYYNYVHCVQRTSNTTIKNSSKYSAHVFDDYHGEDEQGHVEQDQLTHVLRLEALLKEPTDHLGYGCAYT